MYGLPRCFAKRLAGDGVRPSLELQMIVRDGAASLERCLASAAPLVDKILIGDTGSVDGSCALARGFGAKVVSLPWVDHFAAARNHLLCQAECDWILVLDADEMLDLEHARAELHGLLHTPGIYAYGLWRWNYLGSAALSRAFLQAQPNPGIIAEARDYPGFVPSFHIRLFRRHPEIRFQHCVHEDVTSSVDRLRLDRAIAPLIIHHFGYVEDAPELRRRKVERYRELGLHRLSAAPNDFESYLQLGISELQQLGRMEEAANRFEQASRIRPKDSRPLLYLGICMLRLDRLEEARLFLHQAEQLGECGSTLHDALGDLHLCEGKYAQALAAYRRAAADAFDPSTVLAKCGLAEVHLGNIREGMAGIYAAIERHPSSAPLRALLALALAAPVLADQQA